MTHLTHEEFEELKDKYLEDCLSPEDTERFERHIKDCDKCQDAEDLAQKFLDELREIAADERAEVRDTDATSAPSESALPQGAEATVPVHGSRGAHPLFGRWGWSNAIAASLLLVLGGAYGGWAIARESQDVSMALQTSSAFDHGTVRSLRRPTPFDFGKTGIPDHAPVPRRASFMDRTGDLGTLLVAEVVGAPGLDLCAFNADGSLAWQASRTWPDWRALLGQPDLKVEGLKCVVAAGRSPSVTETALLSLRHERQSCLLMIEPRSGHLVGRLFYEGEFSLDDAQYEAIAVMPQPNGGPRRILVATRRWESGQSMPALLVCDHDGTPRQHLAFPLLGTEDPFRVRLWHIRTDWSPTRPEVTVATSEELYFSFLVHDQLLDTASDDILALLGDAATPAYDRLHGHGAFELLAGGAVGSDGFQRYLRGLAAGVKVLSLDLGPQTWERNR